MSSLKEDVESTQKIRVWDIPVRLFHWSLVALVAVCIYTGNTGGFKEMDYHMLSGYIILALILFRIAWGFAGTRYAKFSAFIKPRLIAGYAKGLFNKTSGTTVGHNPLGALSVLALLLVLGTQVSTGLFANDDIFIEGPLAHLVDDETSDELTSIHHLNVKVLYGLLGLHVLAILFYELFKRERLLLAMISGHKRVTQADSATKTGAAANAAAPVSIRFSWIREVLAAALLMAAAAAIVYYLINHL